MHMLFYYFILFGVALSPARAANWDGRFHLYPETDSVLEGEVVPATENDLLPWLQLTPDQQFRVLWPVP